MSHEINTGILVESEVQVAMKKLAHYFEQPLSLLQVNALYNDLEMIPKEIRSIPNFQRILTKELDARTDWIHEFIRDVIQEERSLDIQMDLEAEIQSQFCATRRLKERLRGASISKMRENMGKAKDPHSRFYYLSKIVRVRILHGIHPDQDFINLHNAAAKFPDKSYKPFYLAFVARKTIFFATSKSEAMKKYNLAKALRKDDHIERHCHPDKYFFLMLLEPLLDLYQSIKDPQPTPLYPV